MVTQHPCMEFIAPLEVLQTNQLYLPFTFKVKNVYGYVIDVLARLLAGDGSANPSGWGTIGQTYLYTVQVGATNYLLYDSPVRTTTPSTETEESLIVELMHRADPGTGKPRPRDINKEEIRYKITWIDFDDVSYSLVDEDTFEADLEGWTKTDEGASSTDIVRSGSEPRNGAWSMRHYNIDSSDVAYLSKSFTIGAVSRAFIRVPVFFDIPADGELILELITDAGGVTKKRTVKCSISGAQYSGTPVAGQWLYLGAELPVDGTYEVRLRATCESGTGLELFYDDIKVITKA